MAQLRRIALLRASKGAKIVPGCWAAIIHAIWREVHRACRQVCSCSMNTCCAPLLWSEQNSFGPHHHHRFLEALQVTPNVTVNTSRIDSCSKDASSPLELIRQESHGQFG